MRDRDDREARLAVRRGREHPRRRRGARPSGTPPSRATRGGRSARGRAPAGPSRGKKRLEGQRPDLREGRAPPPIRGATRASPSGRPFPERRPRTRRGKRSRATSRDPASRPARPRSPPTHAVTRSRRSSSSASFGRRRARAEEVERRPRGGAGRVDDRVAAGERAPARPSGRAPSPRGRPPHFFASDSAVPADGSTNGANSSGASFGKSRSRFPRSPFGSIARTGTPRCQELLDEDDAERGLAAARHADDEAVRREVGGIEADVVASGLPGRGVDGAAEEEAGALRGHARDLSPPGVSSRRSRHERARARDPRLDAAARHERPRHDLRRRPPRLHRPGRRDRDAPATATSS